MHEPLVSSYERQKTSSRFVYVKTSGQLQPNLSHRMGSLSLSPHFHLIAAALLTNQTVKTLISTPHFQAIQPYL